MLNDIYIVFAYYKLKINLFNYKENTSKELTNSINI